MLRLPIHLIASERPLINVDATLFINIGLWILLFLILRSLLWRPMLKLIDARENGIEGARAQAKRLDTEGKERRAEFEAAQKRARTSADEAREQLRSNGKRAEGEILTTARATAQKVIEEQRAEIKKQREILHREIAATVPQLAADIATKVLGREVRS